MKETNTITHFCNEGLYISTLAKHCIHFLYEVQNFIKWLVNKEMMQKENQTYILTSLVLFRY